MKDQLSALVDGELELANASHLITAIKAGGEMNEYWSHYHLIGDAMRGDSYLSGNFSARVMSLLDAEPTIITSTSFVNRSLSEPLDNKNVKSILPKINLSSFHFNKVWSIAASVAAVMFVGLMVLQLQSSNSDDLLPLEIAQSGSMEYLQAHQEAAPSGSAYYIQNASFKDIQQ